MKLRTVTLTILLAALVFTCKNDDDDEVVVVPARDRTEVYEENIAEIELYLDTHFYNYDEFDFNNPYSEANDNFIVKLDTIAGVNNDKIPLSQSPELMSMQTTDSEGNDLVYTLYYLNVREGLGKVIHFTDKAYVQYTGTLLTDGERFDSTVTPVGLPLSTIGSDYGVIDGFRDGIIEFKTAVGNTPNADGTVVYHGQGIGAVFIPSGLGYYSTPTNIIPAYSNLIFSIRTPAVEWLDHDNDGAYSFKEDLNENGDVYDDDTDGDGIPNVLDIDDDGDDVYTLYEDINGDGDPTDDIGANGIPKYLDPTETESNQTESES